MAHPQALVTSLNENVGGGGTYMTAITFSPADLTEQQRIWSRSK